MAFAGNWKRTGSGNAIDIMKHIGMSDETIEAFKGSEVTMVIEQIDADSYKESFTVVGKTVVTIMKIGGETEMTDWTGEKFTVVPKRIDDKKAKVEYDFKGVHYIVIREIDGDKLTDHVDLDNGKITGKFIYTKQ